MLTASERDRKSQQSGYALCSPRDIGPRLQKPWLWWAMQAPRKFTGSVVNLLTGHLGAAVVVHWCFWNLNHQLWLTHIYEACIDSTLLSMDAGRKKLLWRAHLSTLTSPNNNPLSLWQTQAFSQTPLVVVNDTLAPSACLHVANTSPFPGVWHHPPEWASGEVDKHFSPETAGKPHPSVHGFLHLALCILVNVLFSEALKPVPAFPAIPASERTSQCKKPFLFFHGSLPEVQAPS